MRGTYHCDNYCKCDIQTSAGIAIKYEGTDHCKYNNKDGDETNYYINYSSLKHTTTYIRYRNKKLIINHTQ